MSEVKRFTPNFFCEWMEDDNGGKYVLFEDYQKLHDLYTAQEERNHNQYNLIMGLYKAISEKMDAITASGFIKQAQGYATDATELDFETESIYCKKCGSCGIEDCCNPGNCKEVQCKYGEDSITKYKEMSNDLEQANLALDMAQRRIDDLQRNNKSLRQFVDEERQTNEVNFKRLSILAETLAQVGALQSGRSTVDSAIDLINHLRDLLAKAASAIPEASGPVHERIRILRFMYSKAFTKVLNENDAVADDLRLELAESREAEEFLEEQIQRLARFIIEEVDDEPSQNEGAVDTAIRVIRTYQQTIARITLAIDKINPMYKGEFIYDEDLGTNES